VSWVTEYARQVEGLQAIVAEARTLTHAIRNWFPIEGLPWVFEGSPEDGGAVCNVVNSAKRLDNLLYPLRLPFDATLYDEIRLLNDGTPPEQFLPRKQVAGLKRQLLRGHHSATRYGFASFMGSPSSAIRYAKESQAIRHTPAALYTALAALMRQHDQLLRHYQWGQQVAGDANSPWPWEWPAVPPVLLSQLDTFDRAACCLSELATAEARKIDRYIAEPNSQKAASRADDRPLNDTKRRSLTLCRRKAHKGATLALRVGMSYTGHIRKVLSALVKEGRLRKTEKGYRTVSRATQTQRRAT
jgi:hypothetical protein